MVLWITTAEVCCTLAKGTDSIQDQSESDVDCGGSCPPCADNKACQGSGDCVSGTCTGGRCVAASCTDGLKNGTESDLDCGGSCAACGLGKACSVNNDCAPYLCDKGKCGLGSGADGPVAVATGTSTPINTISTGATGSQGTTALTLTSGTGFANGQNVFIHQTQGTGAGNQELNRITTIAGTTATLAKPLANSYTAGAQVVAVPQFTTVNVAAGGTLFAPSWNGTSGGILVFQATSTVTIDGTLSMTGQGFRGGGDAVNCFPGSPACNINHGRYGESELGVSAFSTQNADGTGANNGSGGGGGTRGQDCASGAGGSHSAGGDPGIAGTRGVCIANGLHGGGAPGTTIGGQDLTQTIFLGGGGGEGGPDEDGTHPGAGGNGGGMIVFYASALTVNPATGTIDASGSNGQGGSNNFRGCGGGGGGMGSGGGGAGGAIRIITAGATAVSGGHITALGGNGATDGSCGATYHGGNGGAGRIQVRSSGQLTGTTNPPAFN